VFFNAIEPWKDKIALGCESTFNWYWLADQCDPRDRRTKPTLAGRTCVASASGGVEANLTRLKLSNLLRVGCHSARFVDCQRTTSLLLEYFTLLLKRFQKLSHLFGGVFVALFARLFDSCF